MKIKSDIRYKILDHLLEINNSTNEFIANQFLSTLHDDLGTIKRALMELIEDGYIKESNIDTSVSNYTSPIKSINTVGDIARKNPQRLIEDSEISKIRIYITFKGKQFLQEIENENKRMNHLKYEWLKNLVYLIVGASFTFLVNFFSDN